MAPSPSPFASASPLNLPSSATRASSSRHDASSSSSPTPIHPSHETHMLFLGQACHLSSCRREDFLPFHCASCGHDYCSAHRLPHPGSEQGGHSCDFHLQPEKASSGEQGDFLVPLCPLCREPPRGWRRGEDPNLAMDRHLSSGDCPELVGEAGATQSRRVKKANECNYKRCHKIMIVKMECEKCRESFCPSHRAPAQHQCGVSPARAPDRRQGAQAAATSSTMSGGLAGGVAALKRLKLGGASEGAAPSKSSGASQQQLSSALTPTSRIPPSQSVASSSNDTSKNGASSNTHNTNSGNIFGLNLSASSAGRKVDKRAESERLSQLRSLQSRRQRGFKLSPAEEVKLAELSAQLGVSDGGSRSAGFKSLAKRRSKEEGSGAAAGAGSKSEGGGLKGFLRGWGS